MESEDSQLLRRYAEEKSEAAFAELVRRHVPRVYGVALRRVNGEAPLAEEIAQEVFTQLARKAAAVARHPAPGAWLFRSTRLAAAQAMRAENRRRAREQEAHLMQELSTDPGPAEPNWRELRPVLDEEMEALPERDRTALWLRVCEGRTFAEVGAKLAASEDAARMRVDRALAKMRGALARRGIVSTAAALSSALAQEGGFAVPPGLAASVTGAALAGGSAAASAGAMATLLTLMSTGKTMVGLATLAAALALGTAFTLAGRAQEAEARAAAGADARATLDARVSNLARRVQLEEQRVQSAETENARLLGAAAERTTAPVTVEEAAVTSDAVLERMGRVQQTIARGAYAPALQELIWLFDVGMKRAANLSAVRLSFGVSLFAELAAKYPPARAALDERREAAQRKMLADAGDLDARSDYSAITRELKDSAPAIALLEQLSEGDPRRADLARAAFDDLMESRRYALALEGRKFSSMVSLFEVMSRELPGAASLPETVRQARRETVLRNAARDVELLAGAGELVDARAMADRVLSFDSSETTRELLQRHLARAGQPTLLTTPRP